MSKKVEKFLAIERNGSFLTEYKNQSGFISFTSKWSDYLANALIAPLSAVEDDLIELKRYENLAKMFSGRLVVVEATYTFSDLDGNSVEIEEPQKKFEIEILLNELEEGLGQMFNEKAGGDDED
ncbi:hypothetical protein NHG29_01665 [Aerococcaceae bacterium NML160702]|nr:hypothetical protein [Aerococcaceae bacterium NML160702]